MDNCDLPSVRVPDLERIRNARRKRQQQLKRWIQYDKTMEKKEKKIRSSTSPTLSLNPGVRQHPGLSRSVQFSQAVILLEAAARDDLDEGQSPICSTIYELIYRIISCFMYLQCNIAPYNTYLLNAYTDY